MIFSSSVLLLSLIIFLPAAGALLVALMPRGQDDLTKRVSLGVTVIVFLLTVWIAIPAANDGSNSTRFVVGEADMQQAFSLEWISSFNIFYSLGIDGISFPLVILTSFLSVLAMWASWPINKHVKAYCVLFLLLEMGMLGVFISLDFFLFYIFWEVMLLPMYFLIGVWGGPRREYAAIKFFLFTLVGSVLMLIAMLMLYFNSDLRLLEPTQIEAAYGVEDADEILDRYEPGKPAHTFNLLALAEIGQLPDSKSPFAAPLIGGEGKSIAWWAFLLLLIGFLVKVPSVPVHTWLPDAHVEAPTPISMILAGVLLKMGGYGIIRICYPVCPGGGYELAWLVCTLGTVSMVYGAFAALAQKDFKRLVAYSSVSHMGYVVLGLGVWSISIHNNMNADYWKMGMNGAMFQMIGHGLSSAGMFFLVGVIYDRVHHRDLDKFGGLFGKMPVYTGISMGIFFAGLGLPGLCGFIGEVLVVLSVWNYNMLLAVVAASVVILTAGYILWTLQRVYLGPEYKGPHEEGLVPITKRELAIASPLLAFAILFGVYPKAIFNYMEPSVSKTVMDMKAWQESNHENLAYVPAAADAPVAKTQAAGATTPIGPQRSPEQSNPRLAAMVSQEGNSPLEKSPIP